MRTTISVDENLLATAKERARARQQTLGQYIEEALREHFARPTGKAEDIPVYDGSGGLRAGLSGTSNREFYEVLDQGSDIDSLK